MKEYESLNHTQWECKYHVIFIPKYRRKTLYVSFVGIWERCSGSWRASASARSKRDICWPITCVRQYIQEQEKADQRLDQLGLFGGEGRFERLQD